MIRDRKSRFKQSKVSLASNGKYVKLPLLRNLKPFNLHTGIKAMNENVMWRKRQTFINMRKHFMESLDKDTI